MRRFLGITVLSGFFWTAKQDFLEEVKGQEVGINLNLFKVQQSDYSSSHIVQITGFLEFLH